MSLFCLALNNSAPCIIQVAPLGLRLLIPWAQILRQLDTSHAPMLPLVFVGVSTGD